MEERDEFLVAPLNALGAPGKDRKLGRAGGGVLMLVRLVWRDRVSIVHAVVVWFSSDRVCVEWRATSRSQPRMTWLGREDLRPRLLYPRRVGAPE